jgi:hypothetical protein
VTLTLGQVVIRQPRVIPTTAAGCAQPIPAHMTAWTAVRSEVKKGDGSTVAKVRRSLCLGDLGRIGR